MNIKKSFGFTLVELMVSVSIVTLMMSVVFFGYRTFSNRLAVSAATQELALAVRQAQTFGISAKEFVRGSADFTIGYGIYFSMIDPQSYYIFADTNHDGKYTVGNGCGGVTTECVEKGQIKSNVFVTTFCGINTSGTQVCPPTNAQAVSILFNRPNPDGVIKFLDNGGNLLGGTYQSFQLAVATQNNAFSQGAQSNVSVNQTGQVYVRSSTFGSMQELPIVTWSNPANIAQGVALSATQLNATANIPGTFTYTPVAGTVLSQGNGQVLSVQFTPSDNVAYQTVTKTVLINVINSCTITSITSLGSANLTALPGQLAVQGNYAYTLTNNYPSSYLQVFNVTTAPPVQTSSVTIASADGPSSLVVSGNYAYTVIYDQGPRTNYLKIYNISNPAVTPVLMSTTDLGGRGTPFLAINGSYVYYVNKNNATFKIYDISNPASPVFKSTTNTGSNPSFPYVKSGYLYLAATNSNALEVYNVSNPLMPSYIRQVASNAPYSITNLNNYLYVTNTNFSNTFQTFSIVSPTLPVSQGTVSTTDGASYVSVQNNYAYVTNTNTNNVQVFSISTPASPTLFGSLSLSGQPSYFTPSGAYGFVLSNNYPSQSKLVMYGLGCAQ